MRKHVSLLLLTLVIVYISTLTVSYQLSPSRYSYHSSFTSSLKAIKQDENIDSVLKSIQELENLDDTGLSLKSNNNDNASNEESATLIRDIELLVDMLGSIISRENSNVFELYGKFKGNQNIIFHFRYYYYYSSCIG